MSHLDTNYPMNTDYPQQARQQQWPPHLLPPSHSQPSFPSPSPTDHPQHYPPFYPQQDRVRPPDNHHLAGRASALSLNLSSLSVTSPSNHSPINPSPGTSSALSPSTPISPSANPFNPHAQHIQPSYQFDSAQQQQPQSSPVHYTDEHTNPILPPPPSSGSSVSSTTTSPYDNRRTPGPSRSSSATSSSSHLPRKRSFTSTPVLEESIMYDEARDAPMELASSQTYEDIDMRFSNAANGNGSPVDGSESTSGGEDPGHGSGQMGVHMGSMASVGGSMNILGKPMATNNFVTKLYQMINDPKSAHYIAWTELGTSFVVSNVGEFSRSILGSHFKHNNFSSFVRQLNMYGFHKINRTPRAQRTSTDAQTWEFSHHKFLRGRPDLLDEIKRKALEPDPALKHRVELPGEVAAQLGAMREENRRMWDQLSQERKRTERLVAAFSKLWDTVNTRIPGCVGPFPNDILEYDNPNIYVTSPGGAPSSGATSGQARSFLPPLSMNMSSHSLHSMHSPGDSPTQAEFHHHPHPQQQQGSNGGTGGQPSLSRQHSFQHLPAYLRSSAGGDASQLPASPGGSSSMDLFDDASEPAARISSKRPRISTEDDASAGDSMGPVSSSLSSPGTGHPHSHPQAGMGAAQGKKLSRARSDSAPLGYGFGAVGLTTSWGGVGRPRSGSGLAGRGVPNIGNATRGGGAPGAGFGVGVGLGVGGVPNVPSNAPNR
ncbi:putative winged helix DNA-binding domain-containing protein [Lyophyllum shimeji]|uniref:Winged helix DNA-binding domain-containing protein n=1 Tax=Lyophyllum shimeji TaxID=47721 RepID=A0A9P3PU25_LYOSH|nr:putative winged helix DNA-binding domain-containing protein [Lyophyllum shimeji]